MEEHIASCFPGERLQSLPHAYFNDFFFKHTEVKKKVEKKRCF